MKKIITNPNGLISITKQLCLFGLLWLCGIATMYGAVRYSVATGNWNQPSSWSETLNGKPGASIPSTGDVAIITSGWVITITEKQSCDSIIINNDPNNETILIIDNGNVKVAKTIMINSTFINGKIAKIELLNNAELTVNGNVIMTSLTNNTFLEVRQNAQLSIRGNLRLVEIKGNNSKLNGYNGAIISITGDIVMQSSY